MTPEYLKQFPEITQLLHNADHVDVKTIVSRVSLREFIAGSLSYNPAWIKFLYAVRWGFVRLLGMKQNGLPPDIVLKPEAIPMVAGGKISFWKVAAAQEDKFWFAGITEAHLTAHLGVVAEILPDGQRRFHVVTIVHYHRWTGNIYFNVIRPFHHIVVQQMASAGATYQPA